MKIGLVCPYDIFRGGGVQEHALAQAKELRRRGYEVILLTPRPRSYKGEPPENTVFAGNSAKVNTPIKTSLELGASFGRDTIDDLLAEQKFDIIHIHEPEVPVLGSQLVAKAKCPIVATFHAVHPDTPMARTIEAFRIPYSKSIYSKLDEITAVSTVASVFVSERTKRHVSIIPNGIDLASYKPNKGSEVSKQPTIFYIGRLEKRKGVRYLVEAFEIYVKTNPKARLVIAGNGPDLARLESYIKTNKIPNIEFLGFVTDEQKQELFDSADLFCSPALYGESFGIVLLEAMAKGVVTLAGDNPGYSTVLTGEGAISLVNPKDVKQFAQQMEKLLSNNDVREQWRNWALESVQQYDYPKIIDKYEVLYKKILNNKE